MVTVQLLQDGKRGKPGRIIWSYFLDEFLKCGGRKKGNTDIVDIVNSMLDCTFTLRNNRWSKWNEAPCMYTAKNVSQLYSATITLECRILMQFCVMCMSYCTTDCKSVLIV